MIGTFRGHFRNVSAVAGICLVMAGLGLLLVHLVDVFRPQCLVDAQGLCSPLPDVSVLGVVMAGIGLVLVLGAALLGKVLPQRH